MQGQKRIKSHGNKPSRPHQLELTPFHPSVEPPVPCDQCQTLTLMQPAELSPLQNLHSQGSTVQAAPSRPAETKERTG